MLPQGTTSHWSCWDHNGATTHQRGMQTKLNKIMDLIENIGNDIGGFRYEFVFYDTQLLVAAIKLLPIIQLLLVYQVNWTSNNHLHQKYIKPMSKMQSRRLYPEDKFI